MFGTTLRASRTNAEDRSKTREPDYFSLPIARSSSQPSNESLHDPTSDRKRFDNCIYWLLFYWRRRGKDSAHMARVRLVLFLLCSILLSFQVLIPAAVVTLDSIEIFTTHEWLLMKPTVYFRCSGENMTVLPDVKEKHVVYTFKGVESWQPLTELPDIKCKRCGFYEKDAISDDTFDEWEFCASDFSMPDGKYTHFKDNELNATFLCSDCSPHANVIAAIIAVASSVSIAVMVATYKYWQKKKRQHEQARFLKLFEETDDIEDELGIGPLSHVI